jgi:hypothetical protein
LSIQDISAQSFCGHIKYRYRYYQTTGNKEITANVDDFKTEDFYICGNKFKVFFDGDLKDIYIGDSLTYFQFGPDSTVISVKADRTYGQVDPSFSNPRSDVFYNAKRYNTIESNDEFENTTYYFNNEIKVDTLLYRDLKLYHWNTFFKNTNGGLRLITISIGKDITTVGEAVEINRTQIPDIEFAPPKGFKVQTSQLFEIMN